MREDVGSHSCGMGLYAVRGCVVSNYRAVYMYTGVLCVGMGYVVTGCVCTEGLGVVRVYVPGAER